jgi:hypothetical protein
MRCERCGRHFNEESSGDIYCSKECLRAEIKESQKYNRARRNHTRKEQTKYENV